MKFKHGVTALALLGAGYFCLPGWVLADSLLLKDGRLISGKVTRTESGYVIQTRTGRETFGDDEVEHWTHSETSETPPQPEPGAPSAPATRTSAPQTASVREKNVAKLIERGNTALAAGEYAVARDALNDAIALDPRNSAAAQGLGYAYLRLSPPNYFKARDMLEIAYAATPTPPRSVCCNLALALAQTHNPMRAAKVLKQYLTAHPEPLDEPALNALAAAMFQADETTRRNDFFAQIGSFYESYNQKLEATRPGEKRFGTQWMSADEADRKLQTYLTKRNQIEQLKRRINNDRAAYATASENSDVEARTAHPGWGARVRAFQAQMAAAENDGLEAKDQLAKSEKGFELPPIDASLAVVEPEGATAVASAAPVSAAPTGPVNVPTAAPDDTGLNGSLFGTRVPTPPEPSPGHQTAPVSTSTKVISAAPEAPRHRKLIIETNAAAFPVAQDLIVTSADAVADASSITLQVPGGDTIKAQVVSSDETSGLALLRVTGKRLAWLPLGDSFADGAVNCISFPEVNLFDPVPASISGTVSGASGKPTANLSHNPRLVGAPLLAGGKVVGVLLGSRDADIHAMPMASVQDLHKLLAGSNIPGSAPPLDPKTLTMQLTAVREKK